MQCRETQEMTGKRQARTLGVSVMAMAVHLARLRRLLRKAVFPYRAGHVPRLERLPMISGPRAAPWIPPNRWPSIRRLFRCFDWPRLQVSQCGDCPKLTQVESHPKSSAQADAVTGTPEQLCEHQLRRRAD